ncbi:MAG: hypothetical protein ACOYBQ_09940 [Fluviibacter sp.]
MTFYISLFVSTFVLCGSALAGSQTPEQAYFDNLINTGTSAFNQLGECRVAALSSPAGEKFIAAKIYVFDNDPERIKVLSNSAKLNKNQKNALIDYLVMNQQCQKQFLETFGQNPMADIERRFFETNDFIYIDMLNGKISIGEGNRKLIESRSNNKRESSLQIEKLADRATESMRVARQRADSERQALIQSIDQSLGRIRSIDTSPSQSFTNCNKSFDSINCSTFRY